MVIEHNTRFGDPETQAHAAHERDLLDVLDFASEPVIPERSGILAMPSALRWPPEAIRAPIARVFPLLALKRPAIRFRSSMPALR